MAIYEKNDETFFPEDYIIDIEDGETLYLSEEETLEELSDYLGIDFKDMDEAMILVEEHNVKEENVDDLIYLNKFDIIE